MKKLSILMLILFITSVSFADVITKTYYFDAPEVEFDGEYAILQLEDSYHLGNPGEPSLPYIGINLLLPRMQAVSDITIEFYEETPLGNYTIYPKQQPMPLSLLNQLEFTPPDQAIYSSDSPFPTKQYNDYSTHYLAGYSVGSFAVTPLSYVPSTKELNYYKKAVVTLETSYDAAAENAQKFLHNNPEVEIRLAALVDNIDMIGTYTIPQTKADGYDYIIITNSIFENDFQVLADFHEMRGLRSKSYSCKRYHDKIIPALMSEIRFATILLQNILIIRFSMSCWVVILTSFPTEGSTQIQVAVTMMMIFPEIFIMVALTVLLRQDQVRIGIIITTHYGVSIMRQTCLLKSISVEFVPIIPLKSQTR